MNPLDPATYRLIAKLTAHGKQEAIRRGFDPDVVLQLAEEFWFNSAPQSALDGIRNGPANPTILMFEQNGVFHRMVLDVDTKAPTTPKGIHTVKVKVVTVFCEDKRPKYWRHPATVALDASYELPLFDVDNPRNKGRSK